MKCDMLLKRKLPGGTVWFSGRKMLIDGKMSVTDASNYFLTRIPPKKNEVLTELTDSITINEADTYEINLEYADLKELVCNIDSVENLYLAGSNIDSYTLPKVIKTEMSIVNSSINDLSGMTINKLMCMLENIKVGRVPKATNGIVIVGEVKNMLALFVMDRVALFRNDGGIEKRVVEMENSGIFRSKLALIQAGHSDIAKFGDL